MSSFYSFLGVEPSISSSALQDALERKAREINPGSLPDSELKGPPASQWRVLQAARRVLEDDAKRTAYDASLSQLVSPARPLRTERAAPTHTPISGGYPTSSTSQTNQSSSACPTCGAPSSHGKDFCLVCGSELGTVRKQTSSYAGQVSQVHLSEQGSGTSDFLISLFGIMGWRKARGTIVTAEAPYTVENEFILWRFLLKIGIFLFLARLLYVWISHNMVAAFLGVAVIVLLAIFAAGIFCVFLGQFLGFLFSAKLFGKEKQIQVRDVRLRDAKLQEYVVRFRGELRAGQVAVGDEIEIWGRNRGGTIMARWGYNFRTRTRISVKYR